MNKSLLDTDVLSEVAKARDSRVAATAQAYLAEHGRFTLSAVTLMEAVRGYQRAGRPEQLRQFLTIAAQQDVLAFTRTTAELAGKIDGDLTKGGKPIGRADPMIAATAIEHALVLVTGNTEHFARIQALGYPLLLDNWRNS